MGSGSLRISRVSQSDEGVYTCRGDNLEEISDAEATLSVLGMSPEPAPEYLNVW